MKRWSATACLLFILGIEANAQHEDYKLTASDGMRVDSFGVTVSLSGDRAVIGAMRGTSAPGAAYLFNVETGQQLLQLTASDGAPTDGFGISVALSGDILLVGANQDDDQGTDSGSAYLFDLTTGLQLLKLTASDADAYDYFGSSVALSGSLALVGSTGDDDIASRSGAVYVFDAATGQQLHKLKSLDASMGAYFGWGVALSGNLALVGAPEDDEVAVDSGAAYLFDALTGQQLLKFKASDASAGDRLGRSVSLSQDLAVVGTAFDDETADNAGAAHLFDLTTGRQVYKLRASDGEENDGFGQSVSLSDSLAVIGSVGDDDLGTGSGSAYVISLPSVPYGVGCTGSGGFVPHFSVSGNATASGLMTLGIGDAVGGSTAFILQGFKRADIPLVAGCSLRVAPPLGQIIGPFTLYPYHASGPGVGWLNVSVTIPSAAPSGISFTTQAFVVDTGVPRGYAGTNGVEVMIR